MLQDRLAQVATQGQVNLREVTTAGRNWAGVWKVSQGDKNDAVLEFGI